ncbi:MAG: hypothetical protein AB1762_11455, partial [Gemmatimonadota bacterium]
CFGAGALFVFATPEVASAAWYTRTALFFPQSEAENFGAAVHGVGTNVAVGAPGFRSVDLCVYGYTPGVAYLFAGTNGQALRTFPNPTPAEGDLFGWSIAGDSSKVFIGAPCDDSGAANAGSVYLFDNSTGELLRTFQKPIVTPNDSFGYSVAAFDGKLLVGAPRDDTGAFQTGAVYLLDVETGALIRQFADPTPATGNLFGFAVASDGSRVFIGAPGDDAHGEDAGAVHVFDSSSGGFLRTIVYPEEAELGGYGFGGALATSDATVLIGTKPDAWSGARLFDSNTGTHLRTFAPPNFYVGTFGSSVTLISNIAVVGSTNDGPRVYDAITGELFQTLDPTYGLGQSLATIEDGIVFGGRLFDRCGNQKRTAGEQCDDGNEFDGDCCSSHCVATDNLCDDGIACTVGDECSLGECHGNSMTCSDGVVQSDCNEECDDGNLVGGDGCNTSCKLEAGTATPTPTVPGATPTPTLIVPVPTPSGGVAPLGTLARRCQLVLADQARAFAGIAHRQLQGCLDDILAGISDGKTSRLRKALDDRDPASLLTRARTKVLARVATKCRGVNPSEINSTPCSQAAATTAEVALCLLDQHVASVEDMVRAEYGNVCSLLTFYDLGLGLPTFCMAP